MPGGALAFSCERHEGDGFVLGPALRYRHAPHLVAAAAEASGLTVLAMERAPLRKEAGLPVDGLVCLFARPAEIVPFTPPSPPSAPKPRPGSFDRAA
jgi:predicted TPR repeat methyltransferase